MKNHQIESIRLGTVEVPHRISMSLFAALLVATFPGSKVNAQSNWPAFRNDGSGIVTVDQAPTEWSPEKGVAWRSEVPGYGQSAPVIWGDSIFVTSCDGPWQEKGFVHAFDLKSGQKKWTTEVPATTRVENYFRNSRAAPTCVVDANIVVSFFPGGDVTAMDHAGKILWTVPLFQKFGEVDNDRATASSLAQTEDQVYVLVDHHGPSYLIALHKKNGQIAWKADRGKRTASWTSPVIASDGARKMVIASSADTVDAYDVKSGKLLWQVDDIQGNRLASASVFGNSIFVGAAPPVHGDYTARKVAASNCRIRLTGKEAQPSYEISWQATRANASYATPLAFDGFVYYINKANILYCLDAKSGEEVFRERVTKPCWASAIGVKTKSGKSLVYFFLKDGTTLIVKPGAEFELVAKNRLWDRSQMLAAAKAAKKKRAANTVPADEAKPKTGPEKMFAGLPESQLHRMFSYGDPTVYGTAIVEGNLIIRTGQHLYCVRRQ